MCDGVEHCLSTTLVDEVGGNDDNDRISVKRLRVHKQTWYGCDQQHPSCYKIRISKAN